MKSIAESVVRDMA